MHIKKYEINKENLLIINLCRVIEMYVVMLMHQLIYIHKYDILIKIK